MIEAALRDIPIEYRDRFRALLGQADEPHDALADEVRRYVETVQQVGALVKLLDLSVADEIARVALVLLALDGPPEARRLVNTGVRYFVREEDDEEITGVLGFDDDVQVINAVCRALSRNDLVIPFTRPDGE